MNILSIFTSVVLAVEGFAFPMVQNFVKPTVSFADLVYTTFLDDNNGDVLGTGTFSASILAGVVPMANDRMAKNPHILVVALGDSMVDTLGGDLRVVEDELRRVYPKTVFTLANYGVGGENIVSGLERITRETVYLGQHRPSIISLQPDLVIIESFAYNPFPFDQGAIDQHWLSLSYIIDALKANIPNVKIVLAATIAPNSHMFGDGASGLAFSPQDKIERTNIIKQYLQNTIRFAQSEHIPLADAYHASLDSMGDGKLVYINSGDHIHYSDAGRQLFARTVVDTIVDNKLLE